jgi:hypothetical protein
VLDKWARQNIIRVEVPQLVTCGARRHPRVYVHRSIANQFIELWAAWESAGLLDRVVSFHGTYVARFIRGSRTTLSNHAFGTAFDINLRKNRLGTVPALVGEKGSVRELVPLANKHGFYWGGHYTRRPDGMHFEAAKVL